jgi:hypothetical protein
MFELRMECLRLAASTVTSGSPDEVVKTAEKYMAWISTDARFQQSQIRVNAPNTAGYMNG